VPLGIVYQKYWERKERGIKHKRKERKYKEKESSKWEEVHMVTILYLKYMCIKELSKMWVIQSCEGGILNWYWY
jgi:hypothetical protein